MGYMEETTNIKRCPKCGLDKDLSEFHKNKSQYDGLNTYCKLCWLEYCKLKWQTTEKREARLKVRRNWNLKRKYGITHEDYEILLKEQGFKCKICGCTAEEAKTSAQHVGELAPMLDIDHDHQTGEVRGLLCGSCNLTLAQIEK